MTSESGLWHYMNKGMKDNLEVAWLAQRHEDKLGLGVPDVSYAIAHWLGQHDQKRLMGWIELKVIEDLPARAKSAVRIPHLTGPQRVWLSSRYAVGGNVWLLLRVTQPRRYLLFSGESAMRIGTLNWDETCKLAKRVWAEDIDFHELATILLHEWEKTP